MKLSMKDIDPFNFMADDGQLDMFLGKLTGNETFEFAGEKIPKSIAFISAKYAHPRLCSAHGWLLSVDIDDFEMLSNRIGADEDLFKQMLSEVKIGSIEINFGGDLTYTSIQAGI